MPRVTEVVKYLLIINIVMYFGTEMIGDSTRILAMFYPLSDNFQPFQIVTHMFMHGSPSHLFFNMFALFMFGSALESFWGPKRFLFFYLATGLGAAALYSLTQYFEFQYLASSLDPEVIERLKSGARTPGNYAGKTWYTLYGIWHGSVLGASGAVFGLLAGYGTLFPNNVIQLLIPPIPMKAKYFVLIYAAIELFLGMSSFNTGIAHFAHLGGALFGFLLIIYWRKKGSNF